MLPKLTLYLEFKRGVDLRKGSQKYVCVQPGGRPKKSFGLILGFTTRPTDRTVKPLAKDLFAQPRNVCVLWVNHVWLSKVSKNTETSSALLQEKSVATRYLDTPSFKATWRAGSKRKALETTG